MQLINTTGTLFLIAGALYKGSGPAIPDFGGQVVVVYSDRLPSLK